MNYYTNANTLYDYTAVFANITRARAAHGLASYDAPGPHSWLRERIQAVVCVPS